MAVAGLSVTMKVNMIVVMLLIGLGTGIRRFWAIASAPETESATWPS